MIFKFYKFMSSCPRDISENLNLVFVNFRKLIKLIRDLVNNNSQDIHAKITFLKKLNAKFRIVVYIYSES